MQTSTAQQNTEERAIALRVVNDDEDNHESKTSVAEEILAAARLHRVQLRPDTLMIDALAQYDVSESIPPELFSAVAEILVFIQRLEAPPK
jgi:type III secretion system FlhB-like substrate exporter